MVETQHELFPEHETHPGQPDADKKTRYLLYGCLVVMTIAGLSWLAAGNYLLFHTAIELFAVACYLAAFALVWSMRRHHHDRRLLSLAIAFPFLILLHLVHLLSFTGMSVIPAANPTSLTLQVWLAARLLAAISLILFALAPGRRLAPSLLWAGYAAYTALSLALIFFTTWVPSCYRPGTGMTSFKLDAEYVISALFLLAAGLLVLWRDRMGTAGARPLLLSALLAVAAETAFTRYLNLNEITNFSGHLFFAASVYVLFPACLRAAFIERYAALHAAAQRGEEALQTSARRKAVLFATLAQGVLHFDATGRILDVNPAAERLLGMPAERLIGQTSIELNIRLLHLDGTPFAREAYPIFVALTTGRAQHAVVGLDAANGRTRWMEIDAVPILSPGETTATEVFITLQEISERIEAERSRAVTIDILEVLNSPQSLRECADELLRVIQQYAGVEAVAIRFAVNGDYPYLAHLGFPDDFITAENSLCPRNGTQPGPPYSPELPLLECTCGLVLSDRTDPAHPLSSPGGSIWTRQADADREDWGAQDPRFNPRNRCLAQGYRSLALIPLHSGAQCVGLLQLADRAPGRFQESQIAFLERTAARIGLALAHRQAQEALARSSQQLELALQSARAASWEWRPETNTGSASATLARLYGLVDSENDGTALPSDWKRVIHPEDRDAYEQAVGESLATGRDLEVEWRVLAPDGSVRWLQTRGRATVDASGRVTQLTGIVIDIDMQKATESALKESQALYYDLFERSRAVKLLIDPESGFIVEANSAAFQYYGYRREEFASLRIWDINMLGEEETRHRMTRAQVGQQSTFRFQHRLASGEMREVEVFSGPVTTRGRQYLVSIIFDVTEREHALEALATSEERYRRIVETAHEGIWVLDPDWHTQYVNPQMAAMLGYSVEEMIGRHVLDFIDEEWHAFVQSGMERRTFSVIEAVDICFHHRDGQAVWALMSSCPLRDEDGRHLGNLGMFTDISARRQTEEALRSSLEEKTVLLQEVHHRVKNNLQIISSLLNMQLAREKDAVLQATLRTTQERVYSMALLHETLYRGSNLARIQLGDYLPNLCRHLARSAGMASAVIQLTCRTEDILLEIDRVVPCGLIVTELVSNAFKHAFPQPGTRGAINVSAEISGSGDIMLTIADNGAGMPADFDPRQSDSLGMKLVTLLVGQLRGTLVSTGGEGTTHRITFPLDPAPALPVPEG